MVVTWSLFVCVCVVRVKVGYLSEFLSTSCVTKLTFLGRLPSEFICAEKINFLPMKSI